MLVKELYNLGIWSSNDFSQFMEKFRMLIKKRLGLFCAIVITLYLSACESSEDASTKESVVRPVKLITVNMADATAVNQFPAVIGANKLSELSLQVGGKLLEFPVRQAQQLKRGDLIAKLDQRDFLSSLASAKAQYENSEQEYQRAVRLSKEDAIARNVLEQRKTQLDVSKAQLEQAEKALADSELHAPFNGVVAQKSVENLQTVSAGEVLISLMSVDLFKATIDLPASFVARIPKEKSENKNRQAFILLDAAPNQPIVAEFKEATLIADTTSQTYAVTFTFIPPNNLNVLPGMNAIIELHRNNATASNTRVAVPLAAVLSDGSSNYVWVVDNEQMTVSKRIVVIEEGVGLTVVITSGLKTDDVIVGAGGDYLSEGMKIREWK